MAIVKSESELKIPTPEPQVCPNCSKPTCYVIGPFDVPVKFRLFFIITFTATIIVEYCPSCGYLKVFFNK